MKHLLTIMLLSSLLFTVSGCRSALEPDARATVRGNPAEITLAG